MLAHVEIVNDGKTTKIIVDGKEVTGVLRFELSQDGRYGTELTLVLRPGSFSFVGDVSKMNVQFGE